MKNFNIFQIPLKGTHLIEASAGTGKTYTLTDIFLRLVVEQGVSVDRVLVVTYTKAATEELKTRIRQRLVATKRDWRKGKSGDLFLDELRQRATSTDQALQRVQDALIDFDRASIFTIHGFCQRMLQYFTFETGHLFQSDLAQDDTPFVQETCEDFWRRHVNRAPKELAWEALKTLGGPHQLTKILKLCRFPNIAVSPNDDKPALTAIKPWREVAKKVFLQWPQARQGVKDLLLDDGLNGRIYGASKSKKGQTGATPRQKKIDALCSIMDQWRGDYPLFKQFDLFSSHRVKLATKKGKETPQHPFFDLCEHALERHDQLKEQLGAYLRYLKVRLYHTARAKMSQKKELHNVLFFDDLLSLVHQALGGRRGDLLANAIRAQYPIALVDEFQDTDQLQYEIFFKLFSSDHTMLAMIGDPKQAIYSFRGADLFSYLQASQSAQTNTTLTKNWRSTPGLIEAVNTIFSNHGQPFGFKQIGFDRAVPAIDAQDDPTPAMRLWYLPAEDEEVPKGGINTAVAVTQIASAVAREIVQLIERPKMAFAPEDIAILVRTHHQAHIVKQALAQKKVPAVLHSAGQVFDTVEAEQMERIVAAVSSPNETTIVRAALAGPLMGWSGSDLLGGLDKKSAKWQNLLETLLIYQKVWALHGFYAMFRHLMDKEGIKKRVLGREGGERCLTNLLHLAELMHQAESAHGLGPEGVVKWLAFQRQTEDVGNDEQQLRLESDAKSVRIITMHKSKGLQFEVVFCPYTWAGIKQGGHSAMFHHPDKDNQLTLAIGPQIPSDFQIQAQKEALSENLRMLYVALTRARKRCYWVWGRIKEAAVSAPAYLIHGQGVDLSDSGWAASLKEKMVTLQHDQWLQELKLLAKRSKGSIRIEALPASGHDTYQPATVTFDPLSCRDARRRFNKRWRIASFSAMTAGRHGHGVERPDRDIQPDIEVPEATTGNGRDLFSFHRGVRAGLFFHDLLENWDHTSTDSRQRHTLVDEKLIQHGYETVWRSPVTEMLERLAHAKLISQYDSFNLNQVSLDARINEMEFYFPLNSVGSGDVEAVFNRFAKRPANREMADHMGRLHFAPMHGMMKGFIDMVFSHGGRYYLVDWKSNYLGGQYTDYDPDNLQRAINESYYFLQYQIYTVALDQLLRQRLVNYDYDQHFGGVFYFFLRGLTPDSNDSMGIFFDLPDSRLIMALNQLLIAN